MQHKDQRKLNICICIKSAMDLMGRVASPLSRHGQLVHARLTVELEKALESRKLDALNPPERALGLCDKMGQARVSNLQRVPGFVQVSRDAKSSSYAAPQQHRVALSIPLPQLALSGSLLPVP